jgi:hypothetical protein
VVVRTALPSIRSGELTTPVQSFVSRIYDFAVEEDTITLFGRTNRAQASFHFALKPAPRYRQFINLTQVSHEVRKEFLPLHRSQNDFYIHYKDVSYYKCFLVACFWLPERPWTSDYLNADVKVDQRHPIS